MFDEATRVQLIKENFENYPNIEVIAFDGLIVDLANKLGAVALIRGLRVASDFEYEFQMAQMNRHLNDTIETVYLMPTEEHFFTSSNLIKQVFKFTDREKELIPENVHRALVDYYKDN
jgi:pantetheine-phosphate adenylyltransferase